mmetsp:Transcript_131738/g.357734  ORF Transcript_131738/g.357734 Transcript_131738/m.357734 type:complete len:245 (+) Transcript_131738:670-1404(+)
MTRRSSTYGMDPSCALIFMTPKTFLWCFRGCSSDSESSSVIAPQLCACSTRWHRSSVVLMALRSSQRNCVMFGSTSLEVQWAMTTALYTSVSDSTMHRATSPEPTDPFFPKYLISSSWLSMCAFAKATSMLIAFSLVDVWDLLANLRRPRLACTYLESTCTRITWKQSTALIHCEMVVPRISSSGDDASTLTSRIRPAAARRERSRSSLFQPESKNLQPWSPIFTTRSTAKRLNATVIKTLTAP